MNVKTSVLIILLILLIVYCPVIGNVAFALIGLTCLAIISVYKNWIPAKKYKGKGEIEWFMQNRSAATEIGRGAAGAVYIIPETFPDDAFKISSDMGTCRNWQSEYKLTIAIQESMNIYVENVRFAKLKSYKSSDDYCVMQMQRIINPDNENYMIHTIFALPSRDLLVEKRGRSLGYAELLKYLSQEKIKSIFKDLGRFMAHMHLVAKLDGNDIELLLGRTNNDPELRIYVVDFDQIKPIINYSDESVRIVADNMGTIEYFPNSDVPDYEEFRDAYLRAGVKFGMKEEAEKIMTRYHSEWAS